MRKAGAVLILNLFAVSSALAQSAPEAPQSATPAQAASPPEAAASAPALIESGQGANAAADGVAPQEPWYQQADRRPTPGWYKKKEVVYVDAFAGYGVWHSNATAISIGLNFLEHDADGVVGAHIRFLGLGVLSFSKRVIREDGSIGQVRATTFSLSVLEPGVRFYLAGPVFAKGALGFGASFYDGFVPVMDAQLGLGFEYQCWGLEVGSRTLLQPEEVVELHGKTYTHARYGLLGYVILETDFL